MSVYVPSSCMAMTSPTTSGRASLNTFSIVAMLPRTLCKLGRVGDPAAHHLHESRIVLATAEHRDDVGAVLELHVVADLLRLRPPRTLLGAVAVGGRGRLGVEPGDRDEAPVVGDPARGAEEALRAGPEVLLPLLALAQERCGIRRLAADHLDEHGSSLGWWCCIRPAERTAVTPGEPQPSCTATRVAVDCEIRPRGSRRGLNQIGLNPIGRSGTQP